MTEPEIQMAKAMGWGLFPVYDLTTTRTRLMILPTPFPETGKSAWAAQKAVEQMAAQGNSLCRKAVHLMAQSNMQGKKKK